MRPYSTSVYTSVYDESIAWFTAFLLSAGPLIVLFALSLVLIRAFVGPFVGPLRFGWLRLAAYLAVSVGIVYSTYKMRNVMDSAGRNEEQYRRLVRFATDGIVILDRSGSYLEANDKAVEMLGYSREDLLGMSSRDAASLDHPSSMHTRLANLGDAEIRERAIRRKDGTKIYLDASATVLRDGNMMGILRDVTERKRFQQELESSQVKYKSLFDNNLAAVYRFTTEGKFLACNQAFARMFLHSCPAEVMNSRTSDFFFEPKMHDRFLRHLHRKGSLADFELFLRRRDGSSLWALANVTLTEEEGVEIVQGTLIDINSRKRAEERIAASLREKEVLLKEIHHRVKNNLQIISSLLALQADSVEDPSLLAAFQASQERINSIALLHETLYRSGDLARIDFSKYVQSLAEELGNTYRPANGRRIQLNLRVPHLLLDLSVAMPCGLIITELLTNSFKYAFPADGEGEIYLEMTVHPESGIELIVGDTGIGLPPGMVPGQSDSLGLQLVETLVKQLKGTLAMPEGSGAEFRIQFRPQERAEA